MKTKRTLIIACILTILFVLPFVVSAYFDPTELLHHWFITSPRIAPLIVITVKMLAIILPPLPGGLIGLAGIPFFGWQYALLYDCIGTLIGSIVAFLIARKFGPKLLQHFGFAQQVDEWGEGRMSRDLGFKTFLLLRILTDYIFDIISYAAGLTRITFTNYLFATILGTLPLKFLIFYLGGMAARVSMYATIIFVLLIFIGAVFLQKSGIYQRLLRAVLVGRREEI